MTDRFWICDHCNRAWPFDPELEEEHLYCPECGEEVKLIALVMVPAPKETADV